MSTPTELGWGTAQIDGKTYYTCQGEKTPNLPKIRCDLPAGWEHRLSRSTGLMYYWCAAGNNGKGVSQYSPPTVLCNANTKVMEIAANTKKAQEKPLPKVATQVKEDKKLYDIAKPPIQQLATQAAIAAPISPGLGGRGVLPISQPTRASTAATRPTTPTSTKMHVTVNTTNGKKGFNVVETQTPQAGGKRRYNKTRRNKNRKNRSKRNRKNKNRN